MLGILCGLEQEAAVARKIPDALVELSSAHMLQARARVEKLVADGATRLISFGVAGGLAPDVQAGDLVISSSVVASDKRWNGDEAWATALRNQCSAVHVGGVWGSEFIVNEVAAKHRLFSETRCLIVDMESHVVAECAAKHNLPFVVVRSVIDAVDTTVPPAAFLVKPDGQTDIGGLIKSLLCNPFQIPALIRLGVHMPKAIKALDRFVNKAAI